MVVVVAGGGVVTGDWWVYGNKDFTLEDNMLLFIMQDNRSGNLLLFLLLP
jgi:hypothetical protein